MNFYDTTFTLQDHRWPDGIYMNNDYLNVIDYTTQNRQKTHKTQKDEKLISQNNSEKMKT